MTPPSNEPLLQMQDIHVLYNNTEALDGVNFDLQSGELHAIVGEHRAGKSSLVRVLAGSIGNYSGRILLKGKKYAALNERIAINNKIAMFYQNLNVIPTLNAVQNIFISNIQKKYLNFPDYGRMASMTADIMRDFGLDFNITTPLKNLPIDAQNMIELIKVFIFDPDILILDEISSRLTPDEMEKVYVAIDARKRRGKSIIYITHYMNEVFQFADRVTILKNGKSLGTEEIKNIDNVTLYRLAYSFVLTRDELQEENIKLYYLKMYNEQIIRNLPIGVIILNPSNEIYLINNSAQELINPGGDHVDMRFSVLLEKLEAATRKDVLERIGQVTEFSWDEVRLGEKYVRIKYFPFNDVTNATLGNIILIEDITKDISYREYYIRTQRVSSIAELAAGIAHEINNPLGIIKNYVTLLKIEGGAADASNLISKVFSEIERINDIIDSLLSFSKLTPNPGKEVNLSFIIKETLILMEHKLNEKGISLRANVPDEPAIIIGDENRIRQVFFNLLINSIEAVGPDGRIEIELRRNLTRRIVEVAVKDNGAGIDGKLKDLVFEPFFTSKDGKKNTGLGLTICQHIINAHNGVIYFSSTPWVQTVFTVALPMA
jgi:two-component system, NtrC family, sensor histidine kinase AtoS